MFWTAVLMNMTPLILTCCVSLGKYFYLAEPGFLLCEIMNVVWMISKISLDCKLVCPPFLLKELLPREKGCRSRSITASELTRGVVPKLVRQHILLILILRISDPGAPNSSWRKLQQ